MRNIFLFFLLSAPVFFFSQVQEVSLNSNWKFRKSGDKEWLKATVPGTVHTDLLANKKIMDPFLGTNGKELTWIDTSAWEYETTFYCSDNMYGKKAMELQFEGLDTYTKIYLNDSLILETNNMFRSWNVDVKNKVKFPKNKLRIVFEPVADKEKDLKNKMPYTLPEGNRVFTRKAQYQYGWDFAPRFLTSGIWKPVRLIVWNHAKFLSVGVSNEEITDSRAVVNFNFEIDCKTEGRYLVNVYPLDKENIGTNSNLYTPLAQGKSNYEMDYHIENPELWNCNAIGAPKIYHFVIELLKDDKVVDSKKINTGVRKIEWVQKEDTVGKSFYLKLNGEAVFMKGANFVPPDVFLPRVNKEDYQKIVQSAVDANMNMLRVWGGGTYADEEFYNLCDEKGILVWQDFMFACAMYPGDTKFIENAALEVKEQVIRLRNHPCLALWCGNNESDEGWKNWGWQKQFKYSKNDSTKIWEDYIFFFEHLVPDIIKAHDPQRTYVSSSPSIGWGRKESLLSGDSHYWGVWWGMEPFEVYNKKVGRFMSEYGF